MRVLPSGFSWLVFVHVLAVAPASAATVSDLAWLAGCWASEDAEAGSGEQWMQPAGGTLLGMSRTVESGRTVAYEFLQIRETETGQLVYIAHPSGQSETRFVLLRLTASEVVFENPEHDFPQRVIYRHEGPAVLRARIEGVRDGRLEGIDFPMKRISCDAPALDSQAAVRAHAAPR